LRLGNF